MTSREGLVLAVRVFGLYLLALAVMSIPNMISGAIVYLSMHGSSSEAIAEMARTAGVASLTAICLFVVCWLVGLWMLRRTESTLRFLLGNRSDDLDS